LIDDCLLGNDGVSKPAVRRMRQFLIVALFPKLISCPCPITAYPSALHQFHQTKFCKPTQTNAMRSFFSCSVISGIFNPYSLRL
jgi:hypothetical protein